MCVWIAIYSMLFFKNWYILHYLIIPLEQSLIALSIDLFISAITVTINYQPLTHLYV